MSVSKKKLECAIKDILRNGDLDTLSAKKVRRQLEHDLSTDLSNRKSEIDELIMNLIDEIQNAKTSSTMQRESNATSDDDMKEYRHTTQSREDEDDASSSLSSSSSDTVGGDLSETDTAKNEANGGSEPPVKKTKTVNSTVKHRANSAKVPIYARSRTKQKSVAEIYDDSDSDSNPTPAAVDNDEEIARKLQEEEDSNVRLTRQSRSGSRQKKNPDNASKNSTLKHKEVKKPPPKKSGYSAPMVLSPELADIMGADQMARKDVVKRMWEIVKERKLMDPKDKRYHICDEQLLKVFGKKRVQTFGMMKYLKKHIKDPDLLSER